MIVRSHLPWPLRWATLAVTLGFSAALALWAFELGKTLAGLDHDDQEELSRLRTEIVQLRQDHRQAAQVANTADSLLKTERAAQERLAQQLRQLEAEKQALRSDLGFYEKLLPSKGEGLQLRGLQAELSAPGQLKYQLLVVQSGKAPSEFKGRYDLVLTGLLEGKAWTLPMPGGPQVLQMRQVTRLEGLIELPAQAVIKTVQVRVMDAKGATQATQMVRL